MVVWVLVEILGKVLELEGVDVFDVRSGVVLRFIVIIFYL